VNGDEMRMPQFREIQNLALEVGQRNGGEVPEDLESERASAAVGQINGARNASPKGSV
jgi:hypothetical protein